MKVRYGGDLQIGDFLMVADGNATSFGWYCGTGKGTLQYYHFRDPGEKHKAFQEWQTEGPKNISPWYAEKFKKYGFSSKLFWKCYIYGGGLDVEYGSRVVKLPNGESIFTNQEDLETYRKSKEALISIKFPAK
jgi:hypothetical protein